MRRLAFAATASLTVLAFANGVHARDGIVAGGSATVAPYAELVAETFAKTGHPTPEYRASGTGIGLKAFCGGIGTEFPDVSGASRRIKDAETDTCTQNGVKGFAELKFGMDAIVLIVESDHIAEMPSLTARQIWLAVGAQVPVNGMLTANSYKTWSEIDPLFPAEPILVLMPGSGSGTHDAFMELIVAPACEGDPAVQALDKEARKALCESLREDGLVAEFEHSTEIQEAMNEIEHAVGIAAYSQLHAVDDDDVTIALEGVKPTPDTVRDGSYKAARTLYLYVKTAHLGEVPGLKEFVAEFVSEKAIGDSGYLTQAGLIPLSADERKAAQQAAAGLAASN